MGNRTTMPEKAFISYNKADKLFARALAAAILEEGIGVWFDEWDLRPGDSLIGGLERGLSEADLLILMWSKDGKRSNWVGTEVAAFLNRRVQDNSLRIIPIILDDTPLPTLVSDYRGFVVSKDVDVLTIASAIAGSPDKRELARHLQDRFLELTDGVAYGGDMLPYRVCPRCGSPKLIRFEATDYKRDDRYYCIKCEECSWEDGTEI